ncbi:MAG: FAD:protein FMN transferase [Balneolaceae bacterium]
MNQHMQRVSRFILLAVLAAGCQGGEKELQRFDYEEPHMGALFRISLYAESRTIADETARDAFTRIDELNRILSDYSDESELSRLNRTAGSGEFVSVSHELYTILERSKEFSEMTDGRFDITIGPLVDLWREQRGRARPELPSAKRLRRAQMSSGYEHLDLSRTDQSVRLARPEMRLDPGGIGKGYAADAVRNLFEERGLQVFMIDAGGDIVLGGPPPNQEGWEISIPTGVSESGLETKTLKLSRCAITTSGDLYQAITMDGVRYSHIIDPATGVGVTGSRMATVVAPDGTTADALASAFTIGRADWSLDLANSITGLHLSLLYEENGEVLRSVSEGFPDGK